MITGRNLIDIQIICRFSPISGIQLLTQCSDGKAWTSLLITELFFPKLINSTCPLTCQKEGGFLFNFFIFYLIPVNIKKICQNAQELNLNRMQPCSIYYMFLSQYVYRNCKSRYQYQVNTCLSKQEYIKEILKQNT